MANAHQLELAANFFEERIETIELENGGQAFIQRPKPKPEGARAVQSVADLPDDFDVKSITVNSSQLYRVSIGLIDAGINLDLANYGVEIVAKMNIPIIGGITIGKVSGNLKQGVSLNFGKAKLAPSGEIGVRLDGSSVILYWDFYVFGHGYNSQIKLASI